ncbi:hypothetical protein [Schauerella aestuarii]|uniref:hypothetical protein n=1 Tax=Schauerella aestuarii TaxID=2511204 RepID=UPI001369ACF9|nr:hypothetical protein [Achromobacter aestuarii]MYZ43377.1 hypothetical protein [Achromobacter aestuarii]
MAKPLITPDGRYLIVRGRLWRTSNPHLDPVERQTLVNALMAARRAVASAKRSTDATALAVARAHVDAAKHALGERGPVWWTDGAPDLNRHMVHTTSYAEWFASTPRD